jgi:hypothetical protein
MVVSLVRACHLPVQRAIGPIATVISLLSHRVARKKKVASIHRSRRTFCNNATGHAATDFNRPSFPHFFQILV